jgi:lipopolysaccharide transport system permease protein
VLKRLVDDVREMLVEQFQFRELLSQMVRRDLLIRYKQSVMGFGWAVFMPLVNTVIFSVVFMRVAPLDVGMPYPLFAFSGLLAWNLFANALRFSTSSLTANSNLVSKVYFPREIFPFSTVIVAAVDSAVGAIALVALMIYYRVEIAPAILFLPVVVFVHLVLTAGVGLLLAMSNLFYRDVKYLFEVAIMAWMFATSVLYPLQHVAGFAGTLLRLNPMTPVIDAYRSVLLLGTLPPAGPFLTTALVAVVVLAVAWLAFHRAEYQFAENI